jgi:hypothetical protein
MRIEGAMGWLSRGSRRPIGSGPWLAKGMTAPWPTRRSIIVTATEASLNRSFPFVLEKDGGRGTGLPTPG